MDADKTKAGAWRLHASMAAVRLLELSHSERTEWLATYFADFYRQGMKDALELKRGEEKAHLITVYQPDGQIVTVKNPETKEE